VRYKLVRCFTNQPRGEKVMSENANGAKDMPRPWYEILLKRLDLLARNCCSLERLMESGEAFMRTGLSLAMRHLIIRALQELLIKNARNYEQGAITYFKLLIRQLGQGDLWYMVALGRIHEYAMRDDAMQALREEVSDLLASEITQTERAWIIRELDRMLCEESAGYHQNAVAYLKTLRQWMAE